MNPIKSALPTVLQLYGLVQTWYQMPILRLETFYNIFYNHEMQVSDILLVTVRIFYHQKLPKNAIYSNIFALILPPTQNEIWEVARQTKNIIPEIILEFLTFLNCSFPPLFGFFFKPVLAESSIS